MASYSKAINTSSFLNVLVPPCFPRYRFLYFPFLLLGVIFLSSLFLFHRQICFCILHFLIAVYLYLSHHLPPLLPLNRSSTGAFDSQSPNMAFKRRTAVKYTPPLGPGDLPSTDPSKKKAKICRNPRWCLKHRSTQYVKPIKLREKGSPAWRLMVAGLTVSGCNWKAMCRKTRSREILVLGRPVQEYVRVKEVRYIFPDCAA